MSNNLLGGTGNTVSFPETVFDGAKEIAYLERLLISFLDSISYVNPYISTPYFEIEDRKDSVYEVKFLVHIQQLKETKNVESEFDS